MQGRECPGVISFLNRVLSIPSAKTLTQQQCLKKDTRKQKYLTLLVARGEERGELNIYQLTSFRSIGTSWATCSYFSAISVAPAAPVVNVEVSETTC